MVVDGKLKGNFSDEQAAKAAGEELLEKVPMLRVEVYNAETKVRTAVSVFRAERTGFKPATSRPWRCLGMILISRF